MAGLTHIWTNLPTGSETMTREDIKTTVEELDALKARQVFLQRKLESLLRAGEIRARKRRDEAEAFFLEAEMELEKMAEEHKAIRRSAGIDQNMDSMIFCRSSDNEEDAPVIVEAPHSLNHDSPYVSSASAVRWATQDLEAIHMARSSYIAVPCEPTPEPSPSITEKPDSLVISRKKPKKPKKMARMLVEEPAPEDPYGVAGEVPMSSSNAESGSQNFSLVQPDPF